jgi:hypothetical protein
MAQQNQRLDPELIKILLGTNMTAEEAIALKQAQQAEAMGKSAMAFNPRMGGGAGGAMGALAQGLQGYQSGKDDALATAKVRELGQQRMGNREKWFNQLYPQPQQQPQQPPMLLPEDDEDLENRYSPY